MKNIPFTKPFWQKVTKKKIIVAFLRYFERESYKSCFTFLELVMQKSGKKISNLKKGCFLYIGL